MHYIALTKHPGRPLTIQFYLYFIGANLCITLTELQTRSCISMKGLLMQNETLSTITCIVKTNKWHKSWFTLYEIWIIYLPSSIAIPRCTSSSCLEWTRAHDNLMILSFLSSSEPPFSVSATSLSHPYQDMPCYCNYKGWRWGGKMSYTHFKEPIFSTQGSRAWP